MKIFKLVAILNLFITTIFTEEMALQSSHSLAQFIPLIAGSASLVAAHQIMLPKLLIWAVKNEYEDLAMQLIRLKPNFDYQDQDKKTVYHYAFELNLLEVIDELVKLTSQEKLFKKYGNIILFWATKHDRVSYIREAIKYKTDLNPQDEFGMTPLMYAVAQKNNYIARILLVRHADPNIKAKNGTTALFEAVKANCFDCVANLLLYSADFTVRDKLGHNLIYYAHSGSIIKEVFNLKDPYKHPKIKEYLDLKRLTISD